MKFDDYQRKAKKYDQFEEVFEPSAAGFIEKVLGLTGEAGETADKIKKIIRDKNGEISEEDRKEVAKELGDVLWYLAAIARNLKMPLSEVAEMNLKKLESRYQRGKIKGEGDNR